MISIASGYGAKQAASASHDQTDLQKREDGVANGIRTRNNKLHKLGLYH